MQALKTVALDAHTEWGQMAVVSPDGEVLLELQVETSPEELRGVVSAIPGPKRVVLENGPLSAMVHPERPGARGDALEGAADQVVSCDPAKNALVSRSDSSPGRPAASGTTGSTRDAWGRSRWPGPRARSTSRRSPTGPREASCTTITCWPRP